MPLEIIYIEIVILKNYENNSRIHSDEQVASVASSITEFGFTNPILIDGDNVIIAGHCRLMAAVKLGMAKVPCIRLAHLTDDQRRAYIIADNKLALNSTWNDDILAAEIAHLIATEFNIELLGFDASELDNLAPTDEQEPAIDEGIEYKEKYSVLIECQNESHQQEIYNELIEQGHTCKVLVN